MPSHDHRRPTRAYGPVRIPGLRWLSSHHWPASSWVVIALLIPATGRIGPLLLADGHLTAGLLVTAPGALLGSAIGLALLSRERIQLTGGAQQTWRTVALADNTLRWLLPRRLPNGRTLLPEVERARWEIARLLADRQELLLAYTDTDSARYAFDPADPERAEWEQRRTRLRERLVEFDALIEHRVGSLVELANTVSQFNDGIPRSLRHRRRGRARLAGEHADAVLAATARWRGAADPGAELAESADAYARAYRELSARPSGGAGWLA